MIKMILATDINGGLGYENSLPWNIPEDLQYFKNTTYKQAVVMGSKTFESLNFKKLSNRKNIVLTSSGQNSLGLNRGIVNRVKDIDWLIEKGIPWLKDFGGVDTYIIGGKSIYEQCLPFIDEIHWTLIEGDYKCDTFVELSLEGFYLKESKLLSEEALVNIWKRK